MMSSMSKSSSLDIFDLLSEEPAEKPKEKSVRQELLDATKYKDKDRYPEGSISINKHTCVGLQCKLCIKACPTNALYWTNSGVGIVEDLCLHCEACVLCCMVDDCITVTRKTPEGKTERFSRARDVVVLESKANTQRRLERACAVLPSAEEYCKRLLPKK
jgi:Na+-translocating ferredoxin:NAD+ oxidoreductase RNF subunit RnfB